MREDKRTFNEIGLYLSFGNGKAPDLSGDGAFPVYGSNGVIGRSKSANHEHSIILGRVGAYCGSVYFEDGKYWATDNTIVVKVSKGNEAKFFYNLLKAYPLRSLAGGSAQPLINQTIIKRIEAWVPPLPTQRKIAAILTAYDDLIEVNKRRIALLENMAEEIYREWFVRLRFPGHQRTRFVKGVPEGWPFEIGTAFFDHVKGKSYASHEISDEDGACFFITLKSFHRRGGYRKEGLKYFSGSYKKGQSVEAGDVVMAVTDMTQDRAVVGEVARIPKLHGKKAVISLDVIRLMPKNMSTTFLYTYMRYSGFANYIKQFALSLIHI